MLTYINLDEAIQKMNDLYKADCDIYSTPIPECFDNDTAISALKELSTISIVKGESIYCDGVEFIPVYRMKEWLERLQPRNGKWIKDIERFGDNAYHCNQCGAVLEEDDLEWRNNYYCYHCGAKMEDNKDE